MTGRDRPSGVKAYNATLRDSEPEVPSPHKRASSPLGAANTQTDFDSGPTWPGAVCFVFQKTREAREPEMALSKMPLERNIIIEAQPLDHSTRQAGRERRAPG
jgi:hypothetical protein